MVNDTIPRQRILKSLYACDSLNTMLTDNLNKAAKKDTVQQEYIIYLSYQLDNKEKECEVKIKKERKKNNKKIFKAIGITLITSFALGLTI